LADIKYGVFPNVRYGWEATRLTVQESERLGYDSVWLADHLMGQQPILECWTTLSALSGLTTRIRLGTMVLCNSYRNPALLAKMAATLDNISGGRVELGIGAGWKEEEYLGYGYEFPSSAERVSQLEEALIIIDMLWSESQATFKGNHFKVFKAYCDPKPIQKPRIPITVGGTGEKLMLRLVAKYADRSNWWVCPRELFLRRIRLLNDYCTRLRRRPPIEKSATALINVAESQERLDSNLKHFYRLEGSDKPYEEWVKDVSVRMISGTPERCLKELRGYAEMGVTYFMIRLIDLPRTEGLKLFTEKIMTREA
jgi:alkanesulfonate monooxygenase SsuD/methylene tetrahydromethanopterin reductase-like flavin-dependent oxidoreductase (luciferase family)